MSAPQLLLDEHLSERLLPLLNERFPDSSRVRLIGLGGATDIAIWQLACQRDLVLVTKDEDFLDLSVARGCPPRVVCLAIGNASNAEAVPTHNVIAAAPADRRRSARRHAGARRL